MDAVSASRSVCRNRHHSNGSAIAMMAIPTMRVTSIGVEVDGYEQSQGPSWSGWRPRRQRLKLMIFTSRPVRSANQPTPASRTAPRTPRRKIPTEDTVAPANARHRPGGRGCSRSRRHTPRPERQGDARGGLTPPRGDERDASSGQVEGQATPAIINPTNQISFGTPPIRWLITSGFSTQIHRAAASWYPGGGRSGGWHRSVSARPGNSTAQQHGAAEHVSPTIRVRTWRPG